LQNRILDKSQLY
jgi:hypothetical protein